MENSKIILTTKQASFVIYDINTKEITIKKAIKELYNHTLKSTQYKHLRPFGVCKNESEIFICSNNKLCVFDRQTFEYKHEIEVPLYPETHEIDIVDDILYSSNTANDTIGIYNLKTKENLLYDVNNFKFITHTNVGIASKTPDSNIEKTHVNSVYYDKQKLYFCLNNRNFRQSEIWCLDLQNFECKMIVRYGQRAHSIKIIDDQLYYVSSQTDELIEINLNDLSIEKYKLNCNQNIFLRGIEYLNGSLIIGASINYKKDNNNLWSCFVYFDLSTKKFKKEVEYLPNVKFIHDFILI